MLKGLLGTAGGASVYLYSIEAGSSADGVGAYLVGVGLIAWGMTMISMTSVRWARSYLRKARYVAGAKLMVRREGLAPTPVAPTVVAATVIVLDEQPALARVLALASL